jgi:hypothetical protein
MFDIQHPRLPRVHSQAVYFISWIRLHAVSNAILDVAFAEGEPLVAINRVNTRPSGTTLYNTTCHYCEYYFRV